MKKIELNFEGKKTSAEVAEHLYISINADIGKELLIVFSTINPDGLYDDLFGLLSDVDFIAEFGTEIHFFIKNIDEFKTSDSSSYKKLIVVLESTKEELCKNNINFSYEVGN